MLKKRRFLTVQPYGSSGLLASFFMFTISYNSLPFSFILTTKVPLNKFKCPIFSFSPLTDIEKKISYLYQPKEASFICFLSLFSTYLLLVADEIISFNLRIAFALAIATVPWSFEPLRNHLLSSRIISSNTLRNYYISYRHITQCVF